MNGSNQLVESSDGGITRTPIQNVSFERYVVWRCLASQMALAIAAADVAMRMSGLATVDKLEFRGGDGGYSKLNALKSSMKSPYYQQDTLTNKIVTTTTQQYLQKIIAYCYPQPSGRRPNVMCSEFVMACYEAGSYHYLNKTAFGSNPVAMSPLQMENILNYSQHVEIVGRIESIDDILFHAVKEGVKEYDKSLTGGLKGFLGLRRPSANSTEALRVLNILIEKMSASDAFFPVMEHYLKVKAIHILTSTSSPTARGFEGERFYDALPERLTLPLEKGSTFSEILKKHIKNTGLFLVD